MLIKSILKRCLKMNVCFTIALSSYNQSIKMYCIVSRYLNITALAFIYHAAVQ